MAALEKATLVRLKADPTAQPVEDGSPIPVQFNPSSVRMTLSNQVTDGDTRGLNARQASGRNSTDLSFDLHFDTADEAGSSTAGYQSVRDKTALVEQFVLPARDPNDSSKRVVPPRVRFQWGDFSIDGIIDNLSIDFDLFAPDGTPLRAKMGVSIKQQDLQYEITQQSEGQGSPAPAPGSQSAGAPGSGGGSAGIGGRAGVALGGESAADFSARMGLDPTAWRAVAGDMEGTLSLTAGAQISFDAGASASLGLGATAGLTAGASADLDVSFGLSLSADAGLSMGGAASADAAAGFALSAAGGVDAALQSVAIVRSTSASADARRAFGAPASPTPAQATGGPAGLPSTPSVGLSSLPSATASLVGQSAGDPSMLPARPAMPDQPRAPLQLTGFPTRTQQLATPSAPPPPLADPRATTYGFGVPLRPRLGSAADLRTAAVAGRIALRPHVAASAVPVTADPTAPPWVQLPAATATTGAAAGTVPPRRCACGCGGGR